MIAEDFKQDDDKGGYTGPRIANINPSNPTAEMERFANRLKKLMFDRGWSAAELARRAGIQRNAISTYLNYKSLPSQLSLQRLAQALNVPPSDLLPSQGQGPIAGAGATIVEIKTIEGMSGASTVRVNAVLSTKTAAKIMQIIDEDEIVNGKRGR